jgi:hypothetical protein
VRKGLSAISFQQSAFSFQQSAISNQLSAISFQQSAISFQLSATMTTAKDQERWLDRPGDVSRVTADS